ncbi:DUF7521 family protein [Halomarina oriensis]|uniref:Uncharacterized protein n=1 Tax=Halomarina oriensis TaxID=671145 RepID=A0A6B0GW96_9EURY|nr:hypothetical protein [Halomarina oriensis]MWG36853.1 hypothetical protein [Halomarina oriensis]
MTAIQFPATLDLVWVATVVLAGASTLLGLFIGWQAYRGFRRNASRSMRYLSVGLVLLTAVTFSAAFVGSALLRYGLLDASLRGPFTLVVRSLQFVGLAFIAYSLYARP